MESNLHAPFNQETGMDKTIYTHEYAMLLKLLAEVRADAGVTQVQLAKKLSVTQSTISKIERGDLRLDVIQLRTICLYLGTTIEAFILKLETRLSKARRKKRR